MYRNDWIRLIRTLAPRYGVDPQAALAVASSEGLSGGVGDGGHAFGPWQLNDAGGVITGRPGNHRAFAESPQGIEWALQQIAGVAKGLHGQAAVDAIVRRFERPADPSGEIARAVGALGQFAGGSAPGPAPAAGGIPPASPFQPSQIPSHVLASVNQALAGQTTDTPAPLAPLKLPAFVSKPPGAPPSAQPGQSGVRPSATAAPGTPPRVGYPLGVTGRVIGVPYQGSHTLYGNWESDNAVDIAVPVGTPVYATAAGVIGSQIGPLNSSDPHLLGNRLHLVGGGNEFYYAHLSRLAVKAGQRVKAGQLLGYSGAANNVAHLHIAVRRGDPRKVLPL